MSDCWSSSRVSNPDSGDQSCRRDKLVRFDFPAGELAAGASSKSVNLDGSVYDRRTLNWQMCTFGISGNF
jgi:hypothetical protein